jgi:hypothetical protein
VQWFEVDPRSPLLENHRMNTSRYVLLTGTLLFGLSAAAVAAESEKGNQRHTGHHERGPIVLAEAEQRFADRSAAMDLDGDGYITADEALAYHQAMQAERMKQRFERRHGERISVQEHAALQLERLSKLDTNGDGIVDRDEMRAARKEMRERRHGRGHGEGYGKRHMDKSVD